MAVTYINKTITLVTGDAITTDMHVRALHIRRTIGTSGAVQIREGSGTTQVFQVNMPGTGATGVNGYIMEFGDGGMAFDGGLKVQSANAEMTVFLA